MVVPLRKLKFSLHLGAGIGGVLVGGMQTLVLERSALRNSNLMGMNLLLLLCYLAALFTFYALVPLMLRLSSSLMLNLSLITANVWAAVA